MLQYTDRSVDNNQHCRNGPILSARRLTQPLCRLEAALKSQVRITMTTQLARLDAVGSAQLIRERKISARELVTAAIERIEAIESNINAVVSRRFDQALDEAAEPALGGTKFGGVPILLKDIDGASAGDTYFAGSNYLKRQHWRESKDCFAVARLKSAGFIVLGKTATPEFALSPHTVSAAHGLTRNPWNLEYSAGGSSGGSGAAVAARLVPVAHGSDAGGSIRIPAAANGVVGLKPSRGRVSNGPREAEPWGGLLVRGPLTRSVRDAAALLDVMSARDDTEPYGVRNTPLRYIEELSRPLGQLRVGFLDNRPDGSPIEPEVADEVRRTATLLAGAGCKVDATYPVALADISSRQILTMMSVWLGHALSVYTTRTGRAPTEGELEPFTAGLATFGRNIAASEYVKVREEMHAVSRQIKTWWEDFDLLVTATMSSPPKTHDFFDRALKNADHEAIQLEFPFTTAFNVTGQPAVSLPMGMSSRRLPIGIQLVAAPGREDVLIRAASHLEIASPWSSREPKICAR